MIKILGISTSGLQALRQKCSERKFQVIVRLAFVGRLLLSGAFASLIASVFAPNLAQADEDLPTYKMLSCEQDCPTVIPAKALTSPLPDFPIQYRSNWDVYVEALVDVDFTIGIDGRVKSPVVEFMLGPPEFANSVMQAISQRTYQPATENGVPVEENHRTQFVFRVSDVNRVARPEVAEVYERAVGNAKNGKVSEAIAALNELAARPRLNFYERSTVSFMLAKICLRAEDYLCGLSAIRTATIEQGMFLDRLSLEDAIRLRITLEALNGEFGEAFAWFDFLGKKTLIKDDDPTALLVKRLHATIGSTAALFIDAQIATFSYPSSSDSPSEREALWHHTLLRRSFEFHQINGKLDRFELHCDRHSLVSAVSDKANWSVPLSWSGCYVNVYGASGTKFQFVEMPPAANKQ